MKPLSDEQKRDIVSLHSLSPRISQREISSRLGIPQTTISFYIRKYENELAGEGTSKRGRPRKQRTIPEDEELKVPAKRGRPRKQRTILEEEELKVPAKRGRPRKLVSSEEETPCKKKLKIMQAKRKDPKFRSQEAASKRKKRKMNFFLPAFINTAAVPEAPPENDRSKERSWQRISDRFFKAVEDGPVHPCFCCDRLWFKESLRPLSKSTLISKGAKKDFLKLIFYKDIGDQGNFCKTCADSIGKLKVPELAVSNGFEYPEVPDCLNVLSPLEERLVSPRLPFMQITPVRGQQLKLKGSVVNVPISLDSTVNQLPRRLDDTFTLHVKLKKRLTHKSHYMYEIINPERVFRAAEYLSRQELHETFGVGLSKDWFENFKEKKFDVDQMIVEFEEDDDEDLENAEPEINPSSTHTLITQDSGLCLAPGENQRPISLLYDNCSEELSFPTIYCGRVRCFKTNPSYTKIANSEMRRSDRRAARPDHLLYAYCKFNHLRLSNAIQISIRKKKYLDSSITAAKLLDDQFVNNLVQHNEGFKFMKNIKTAPAHWEKEKKRVFAAIRQFGLPTLFITLSAAETHWYPLMKTLSWNIDRHDLTKEEFEDKARFSYEKKCDLIQKDPVTCALYFDHRYRELMKTWKSASGPFEGYKLQYYYYRIEFQHRGSPHAHMIAWLEDAPEYTPETVENCEKFIDRLMTCSRSNPHADYQKHKHTQTCYRKNGKDEGCRFKIPFFPMDRTRILDPLSEDDKRKKKLKEQYDHLREYLSNLDWKENEKEFSAFLDDLKLSLSQYLDIIRSGINITTVCLKREVKEIMTNHYSPKILNLMRSNMDIQFITNAYACASYMVDYINKSQRGMSTLLKKCMEECRKSENSLKDTLRNITNTFLNNSEVSAQEAAWSLLELPMSRLSVNDIFVPTFPPGDRVRMVKDQEKLKQLPKDSRDVFEWSIFDKYVQRPIEFEHMCLATFATSYEFTNKEGKNTVKLQNCEIYARERRIRKILRSVNYKRDVDEENFYREQITLYTDWRDETEDILNQPLAELYAQKKTIIEHHRLPYNKFDVDALRERCQREEEAEFSDEPVRNEDMDEEEANEPMEFEEEFKTDIKRDLEEYSGKEFEMFKVQNRWEDVSYWEAVRKTNVRQFHLLKHLMHKIFADEVPLHVFVTGPAGCGKSFTINLIEQTLIRMYEKRGSDPSNITVLKVAPTGKAAYNIRGTTLHCAFALPTKITKTLLDLSPSTLNEYQTAFMNMKTIIIDEISMVGFNMLRFVDQRARQIMAKDMPFGGLNVLAFGDFRQLPPVGDSPVYQIPRERGMDHLWGNVRWESFRLYELTEIMRQKEDLDFARCLNHLADGTMTPEDVWLVRSRVVKDRDEIPGKPIHLFFRNSDVDAYNCQKAAELNTEGCTAEARDTISGSGTKLAKKNLLQKVKKMRSTDTANLLYRVNLRVDAKYMLVYNVNTSDGLVNGAMGVLKKIEYGSLKKSRKKAVKTLWIEFDEKDAGRNARKENFPYVVRNKFDKNWTPIRRMKKIVHKTKNCPLSVCREQFPLKMAQAITIHKSQGATYNECVVHLDKSMRRSLLYVAMSRATTADGLHIVGEFEPPERPSEDDPVTKELTRLRSDPITPVYMFLHERGDFAGIQFMFHNVEGLSTHLQDIVADPCFMHSDLIFLAETGSLPGDDFQIPGFVREAAVHSNFTPRSPRKKRGVMTFIRGNLKARNLKFITTETKGVQIAMSYFSGNLRFAVLYAKPRCTIDDVSQVILDFLMMDEDAKTVLVGDFNIDFNSARGLEFIDALSVVQSLELRTNRRQHTTRGHTTIDAIFSNVSMQAGVYMMNFGYHHALYGRIDKDTLFPDNHT